jgi:CII-binding regulator of phage lambda lysogenization HflD
VTPDTRDKLLVEWENLPKASAGLEELSALPRRIDADPERVERGLAQLVLTLVELLRQLMERQAVRRKLDERMDELKREFGLEDEDLNLDLGPLGRLLD